MFLHSCQSCAKAGIPLNGNGLEHVLNAVFHAVLAESKVLRLSTGYLDGSC